MGCYIWYIKEGTESGCSPPRVLHAVPNVTVHPSTTSVPITVLRCNGPLLYGFNVPIKGLSSLCLWKKPVNSVQRNTHTLYIILETNFPANQLTGAKNQSFQLITWLLLAKQIQPQPSSSLILTHVKRKKWYNINRMGPGKRVNEKSGKAETTIFWPHYLGKCRTVGTYSP